MHSFHYRDGELHCEDIPLSRLASEFATPLYVYSAGTILDHYRRLDAALAPLDRLVCYAVKANSNGAILKLLAEAGAGFDIVSGGELFRVLKAGGAADKCTFAGVGKSREEIEYALDEGVFSFNVESEAELEAIDCIARDRKRRAAGGGLRKGRAASEHPSPRNSDAYRLADHRRETVRGSNRESRAAHPRAPTKIRPRVLQRRRRNGN